jgi:hypothetical protein
LAGSGDVKLKVGYLPFPAALLLRRLAENVIAAHNALHRFDRFAPDLLVSASASLERVSQWQQLYVFAFGRAGDALLCGDGPNDCLDADALARRLRDEGLTRQIRKIKLWASHSGSGDAESSAARLKRALVAHGFTHVAVYGYTKALGDFARDGHKVAADVDEAGNLVTAYGAKSVRVRF